MSEMQGRPASSMSAERRYGIAISVALILGGVYWALTGLTEGTETGQSTYDLDGQSLVVEGGSTAVEIRPGDGTQVKVDREFKRSVLGSDPKDSFKDGTLKLDDGSCGFLSFNCKTTYILTVPRDAKLTVTNSSGSVKVAGMTGETEVRTSSGSIEAQNIGGTLRMESSSGSIKGDGLTASSVTTKNSSGDADLEFGTAPQSIDAKASSGDVKIGLPVGDETYKIETDTSSGDNEAEVKTDASSTRTIRAKTSSGDVTVEYNH